MPQVSLLRPGILHANAGGAEFSRTFHLGFIDSIEWSVPVAFSKLEFSNLVFCHLREGSQVSKARPGAPHPLIQEVLTQTLSSWDMFVSRNAPSSVARGIKS